MGKRPYEMMQEAMNRELALKESRVWAWPALLMAVLIVVIAILRS